MKNLRIGIVGCGKIADGHAEAVKHLEGAELTAVCDREPGAKKVKSAVENKMSLFKTVPRNSCVSCSSTPVSCVLESEFL